MKSQGKAGNAEPQLFEYCYYARVPFAVLTDGTEWHFFLPWEPVDPNAPWNPLGNFEDTRAYKLDLLERDDDDCCNAVRTISFDGQCHTGQNIQHARADIDDGNRLERVRITLPVAWHQILADPDDALTTILADKVGDLCGFRPDIDTCVEFIAMISTGGIEPPHGRVGAFPPQITPSTPTGQPSLGVDNASFVLDGQRYEFAYNTAMMVGMFNVLANQHPDFLERFAARKHGSKNRFLAQDIYQLYPDDHRRCEQMNAELEVGGWFVATNQGQPGIGKCAQLVCEVLGFEYGKDLVVRLKSRT